MPTVYPNNFPDPTIEGFSISVASGVIRSSEPSSQVQRRVFKTMPHSFTLRFVISTVRWFSWQQWVTKNGYKWFTMNLPSMYAGKSDSCASPLFIRFTSDVQANAITNEYFEVMVTAETAPSVPSANQLKVEAF